MNMERLSGDFNRGYTKAIQDIEDVFVYVQDDLNCHNKRLNFKLAIRILELFLRHRENFRESRNGFIRWNTKRQELEFFNPDEMIKEYMNAKEQEKK